MTTDSRETAPVGWEVSEVRTVDGEAMVVGGEGDGFGLIATVTDPGDARLISAAPDLLTDAQRRAASCPGCRGRGITRKPHGFFMCEADCDECAPTRAAIQKALGASHG